MVRSCAAFNCTVRWKKGVNTKFHSIPLKDCTLRKAWLHALRRKNYNPKNACICEKHFLQTDYEVNVHGNKVLKKGAIPSVFDFPQHLKRVIKQRRILKRKLKTELGQLNKTEANSTVVQMEVDDWQPEEPSVDVSVHKNIYENMQTPSTFPSTEPLTSMTRKTKPILRERRQPVYFGDFRESDMDSKEKRMRFWKVAHETVFRHRKLNKYYRCKVSRLKTHIKNINALLEKLREEKKIDASQLLVLQESIPEAQKQMVFRQIKKGSSRDKYSPELRCFALTLHFYSASAYNYVRRIFGKYSLPHPRTLSKWYSSVDGTPGYTVEALQAVKVKVKSEKQKGRQLIGGLIMDEMSIHENLQWTGSRHVGYVDFGTGIAENDSLPKAKNALVFMLVGLNTRWKVPIAYFLVNSVTAEEKSNLVKGCLHQLASTGVIIKTLTFDGCASNLAMCRLLGANLEYSNVNFFFINPVNNEKIHIILDACHMVKLIRNTLGDWGLLRDGTGDLIKWNFFKELVNMQNESGLHCATRLRTRHLQYSNEKMKVKLAVQTLSASVADAIEFCNKDLNITAFEDSEATVLFCRNINNIFDFLNTRNFFGNTKYKKPLYKHTYDFVMTFVNYSVEYLSSLKTPSGDNILFSGRKTGFLGLIMCLRSVQNLFNELVQTDTLKYLLTYKVSQDHLEMFFSAIRLRGGFNNNPTAWQFENAYKRLLVHTEILSPDTASCIAQDNTSILNVTSKTTSTSLDLLNEEEDLNYSETQFLENYSDILNCLYITDIVEYISGFISRKLIKSVNCNICATSLTAEHSLSMLLNRKNRGKLVKPSRSVVKICMIAETVIKCETNFSSKNILIKLISLAIRKINIQEMFLSLSQHCMDQDPLQGHILQLIKLILKNYFNIRLHHINATSNEIQNRVRHKLTKTIIFSNQ